MLSEKLKEIRKAHNLTQIDFAKIFNISNGTIAMWETGKRQPDLEMLKSIANYFNVSIDYLLDVTVDGDRINTAREILKNLSLERNTIIADFEEKIGVNYQTFRAWLNKRSNYFNSAENLLKLGDYFGVSLDYLLTGKETSPSEIEELENAVSWHRDGKTTVKQLTKEEMKIFEKMMEAMGDDTPDYL